MATAFARQLQAIALNSSHELDVKARRDAHGESLIFPKDTAIKQDWDSLYQICIEGYRELCQLDGRLTDFDRNLFSQQSKEQDRDRLNKAQTEALDTVIEQCLQLLGPRLVLRPGIRCLEWLVRRFRVHVHNVRPLLCTILPYYAQQIFVNVLSIVSKDRLVDTWKWLRPYKDIGDQVPRHAVVFAMVNNNGFFDTVNGYVMVAAQSGAAEKTLLRFWSSLVVEAVNGRLAQAKSGRAEIQRQRTEDVLLKVVPLINDGIVLEECPDMVVACFTLTLVIAATGLLQDEVLDKLMEAVSDTLRFSSTSMKHVLMTLSILAAQKGQALVSPHVLKNLFKVDGLMSELKALRPRFPVQKLLYGTIQACLHNPKEKTFATRFYLVNDILKAGPGFIEQAELTRYLITVISAIQTLGNESGFRGQVRGWLIEMLQKLHEDDNFSGTFSEVAEFSKEQSFDLELLLQTSIHAPQATNVDDIQPMETNEPVENSADVAQQISEDARAVKSFLVQGPVPTLTPLTSFLQSYTDGGRLVEFESLSKTHFGKHDSSYPSFLLRVASSGRSSKHRAAATSLLTRFVQNNLGKFNTEILVPYLAVLFSDAAADVRRETVTLVKALAEAGRKQGQAGILEVYSGGHTHEVHIADPGDVSRIIEQVLFPLLAECELDRNQVGYLLRHVFNGSPAESAPVVKHVDVDLKKAQRTALFQTLISAALTNPLLSFKVKIFRLLDGVYKVGTVNKFDVCTEFFKSWMQQTNEDAMGSAKYDTVDVGEVDQAAATLISAPGRNPVGRVFQIAKDLQYRIRPDFTTAIFQRLRQIWGDMSEEAQSATAKSMFELSFCEDKSFAQSARAALEQLQLSTSILKDLLADSAATIPSQSDTPTPKRRRTSHGRAPPSHLAEALNSAVPRLSFMLELVDGAKPENRPMILPTLFDVMLLFRRLKGQSQPVSPYLLNICLGSIHAILEKQRAMRRPNIDLSVIRADVITDFVRTTESPQVQATAMQVLASLTAFAPERIIHNIMPVFTFMGTDVLSKDDEHSINVVNQVIDQVIPPLVDTLKSQDESNLVRSTSGILSSFVSAFDHIPSHRRARLYQRLLNRLGRADFAFALLALLAIRKVDDELLASFLADVLKDFGPIDRVVTFRMLISLAKDVFAPKPALAEQLAQVSASAAIEQRQAAAVTILKTASEVLNSKQMRLQIRSLNKTVNDDDFALHEELALCLHQILEFLHNHRGHDEGVTSYARNCLDSLLRLSSITQLMEILAQLLEELQENDKDLKPLVLRVLAVRLESKPPRDSLTATAAMQFLQTLRTIMQNSDELALTYAAVQCIDKIADLYGRKDIETLVEISSFLAGYGLDENRSPDLSAAIFLCLASIVDIIKDGAVPVVPALLEKVQSSLQQLDAGVHNAKVFEAICSTVSAILVHVPYMVDERHISNLLRGLIEKAGLIGYESANESRSAALNLLAGKVDLAVLLPCLTTLWRNTEDLLTPQEKLVLLDVLNAAVKSHARTEVMKSAEVVANFLLAAFDTASINNHESAGGLVAEQDASEVQRVPKRTLEILANGTAIDFVYMLNDTTFRPIFESWIDWADNLHRQITLFGFLHGFFDSLKSIVTSYSAYILDHVNAFLTSLISEDVEIPASATLLYQNVMNTLSSALTHDADAFFANPAYFSPLWTNLLAHLPLADNKDFRPLIFSHAVPTIVRLARAVQDTSAHLLTINHALCQLRHSESPHVRLVSIQTMIAITEDEDVGDEWISNAVQGTGAGEVSGSGRGSGETMIYVNEMLEDDDENVERKVRQWVRMVKEKVGEDIFEF